MDNNAFTGPLTLEELKKFLAVEKSVEEINKRATIEVSQPSRTVYHESPKTDFLIRMQLYDKDSDLSDDSITEYLKNVPRHCPSDYEEPTDFIQQVSDVLQINDNEGIVQVGQDSLLNDSIIVISDDEKSSDNVNCRLLHTVKNEADDTAKNKHIEIICIDDDDEGYENEQFVQSVTTLTSTSSSEEFEETSRSVKSEECYYDTLPEKSKETSYSILPSESFKSDENNSKDKSTENNFNDTLEEIEMVLKYGLDYSSASDDLAKNSFTLSPPSKSDECIKNSQVSRLPIPVNKEIYTPNPKEKRLSGNSKEFQFKQPMLTTNAPKLKASAYKNVVSPVAVYIKNSPSCPILRNVQVTNKKILFNNQDQEHRVSPKCNAKSSLPGVVYKPPRQVITTTKSPLKLPSNIKKLLPPVPNLIKHQGRVVKKKMSVAILQHLR